MQSLLHPTRNQPQAEMDNTVRNYIDHVERDLLEAKHHLQSGLDTALERVGSMANISKTVMSTQAVAKLRAIKDISEKSIDAIEKHRGRLNFVASQGDIRSYDDFDQLAQPLAEALHDAQATLAKVDEIGTRELGSAAGTIGEACAPCISLWTPPPSNSPLPNLTQ